MNIAECPHCYNKVMFSNDNTCPSCLKNANDVSKNNKDFSFVLLQPGYKKLPNICIMCGQNTKEIRSLSYNLATEDAEDNIADNTLGFFLLYS